MENYKEMYLTLFSAITKVVEILKTVQQETEKMFIENEK